MPVCTVADLMRRCRCRTDARESLLYLIEIELLRYTGRRLTQAVYYRTSAGPVAAGTAQGLALPWQQLETWQREVIKQVIGTYRDYSREKLLHGPIAASLPWRLELRPGHPLDLSGEENRYQSDYRALAAEFYDAELLAGE